MYLSHLKLVEPHDMNRHKKPARMRVLERFNYPNQVCEFAMAHVVGDAAERAYQRSDLFDKRRELMNAWSRYALA